MDWIRKYFWPWLGFVVALSLHLWRLDQPAQLVSDEVYFVQEGRDYLISQPYFDPHPPLGKMTHGLVFSMFGYHPLTWRITNAVQGALMLPLLWWFVWRLTRSRVTANIALFLSLLDGLVLVESRLGMINIPYVVYGLSALACVLKALETKKPIGWLLAAGLMIGAAVSTKWLALAVAGPAILLWFWPGLFGQNRQHQQSTVVPVVATFSFFVVPVFIYWLVFRLHFGWLGLPDTTVDLNLQILNYQLSVPASGDPNGLPWWGWLLAWKPFPYWGESVNQNLSLIRSLPNPWMWWTGAVLLFISLVGGWRRPAWRFMNIFLLASWLPFALIQRTMYSYHMLQFGIFLSAFIAVVLGSWWQERRKLIIGYLVISALIFFWFAPWYLNLPLTKSQHRLREWLPSWRTTIPEATLRPSPPVE